MKSRRLLAILISIMLILDVSAFAAFADDEEMQDASGQDTPQAEEQVDGPEIVQQEDPVQPEQPSEPAASQEPSQEAPSGTAGTEQPTEPAGSEGESGSAEPEQPEEPEEPQPEEPAVEQPKYVVTVDSKLAAPKISAWTRKSQTSMQLRWSKVAGVTGYEIDYDTSKTFRAIDWRKPDSAPGVPATNVLVCRRFDVRNPSATALTMNGLGYDVGYNVRIRSYVETKSGSTTTRRVSKWTVYSGIRKYIVGNTAIVRNGSKPINFNSYLPITCNRNSMVLQGSCTDGTYDYYIYQKKYTAKCMILKVNASTNKKVKVSGWLKLNHANDATYNPDTGRICVVHWDGSPFRISIVNPSTLKIEGYRDIRPTMAVKGMTAERLKTMTGYAGITYNSTRKQYALRLSGSNDLLLLNGGMGPYKFVPVSRANTHMPQGLDSDADHIYNFRSTDYKFNLIEVYDWDGNYQGLIRFNVPFEIEAVFHRGGAFYGSFYKGYYKNPSRKKNFTRESYTYRLIGV